ncbi:T9SS sorting signal type C domain-containing protein [Flavobacterium sp. AS60]|uniref:T9SS sorting signal type C domain-containing protein n=1 Tax=Flavobacterium anseongense TaxID=2910677 RepID=UPI001F16E40C|nr:T9SS sorting signal type C domain-containing protein [Flavobacterium sp. AS60]MCF6128202.1 T9SS sorting signal type C domain-containing protein [Flavobacterium sp. AS60]
MLSNCNSLFVLLLLLLGTSGSVFAQTNTFNVASGAWNTAGNWSLGLIPTSAHDVVIPSGRTVTGMSSGTNPCKTLDLSGTLTFSGGTPRLLTVSGNVTINSTAIINMTGSNTYYIDYTGNFTMASGAVWNLGTGTEQGLRYTGSSASTITNNSSSPLGSLTVSGAGVVTSGSALTFSKAITINSGRTFAASHTVTANAAVSVAGSFQLNNGGWATGSGVWTYTATTGTLIFANTGSNYTVNADVFWPTTAGPYNVSISGAGGGINMTVARTVPTTGTTGVFQTVGQVTGTALTLNGTAQINANGYFTSTPTYGGASTLVYSTGAGYGMGNEWTGNSNTAGSGVPFNVTIQTASTVLTTAAAARGCAGTVTVNASCGLTLNGTNGDLYIGGSFTQNGTFTHNNKAVFFNGSGTQTITGSGLNTIGATNCFAYLVNNNTAVGGLVVGTNVTVDGASGDVLQLLNTGPLKIGAFQLTVNGNGGNIRVTGGTRVIDFTNASGVLRVVGSTGTLKTVASTSGGLLSVTSSTAGGQLQIQAGGLDCGAGLTTIQTGAFLTINSGGYVANNSPTYATGSTLSFRTGAAYGVGSGDKTWAIGTSGAGVPDRVQINAASTDVQINEDRTAINAITVAAGTLTNNTNTLNLGAVGGGLAVLTVSGGTLTNNGGTFNVNGNISMTTGTFNMTSGNLNIDPNSGVSGTSVASGTHIFDLSAAVVTGVTGGTILFNDPPFSGAGLTMRFNNTSSNRSFVGNTMQFGGATGNASTATNGFNVDTYVGNSNLQLGNVIANGGAVAGANRFVSGSVTSGNGFDIWGNLTINSGSEVRTISGGTVLRIKGNIINNGTLTDITGIAFNNRTGTTVNSNTTAQTVSGGGTFQNLTASPTAKFNSLTFDNTLAAPAAAVTFSIGDVTLSGTATFTNGIIDIGNNNSFNFVTTTSAVARTNGYVLIQGTGQMKKDFATGNSAAFTYHVGENTVTTEYSPFTLDFSASSDARTIGVRPVDAIHPDINDVDVQTDYISRYWQLSNSAAGTYTYTASATYLPVDDIVGTEGNIKMNVWNGASPWKQATSTAASNVLTITSGVTETTLPITTTSEFTGRVKASTTYTWDGSTDTLWTTAANWTPDRTTPSSSDILVFDGSTVPTPTVTAVPAETIGKLLLTGNVNVTLQSAAAVTLTISGGAGTDLDIPSGSHLQLGSTGANSINLAYSGTQTASIAGTLTLGANTSSNNTYTVTNSTTTVTGTINSAGLVSGGTTSNLLFTTGTYNHNNANAGVSAATPAIPTATWGTTSTCAVLGLTSPTAGTFPNGLTGQTFGNFTWNTSSLSTAPNIGGGTITAAGTFTMTSTGSAEFRLGTASSGTIVCTNYSQSGGTINCAAGAGTGTIRTSATFNQSGGTITESSTGSGVLEFNGSSSQSVTTVGTISNTINVTVSNPTGIAVTGTLAMNAGTTFTAASSGTAVTSGTVTYGTTTTLAYVTAVGTQTTGEEFPATNGPVNVTFNNTFSTPEITLSGSRTVTGALTITAGRILLGSNDLISAGTQSITTPGTSKMIVINGSGLYKRSIATGAATYLFPIGENTGTLQYSPVSLQFTANSVARVVGAKVIDDVSVNMNTPSSPTNYLSRYWTFSENGAGGTYNYYINPALAITGAEDENGTASLIKAAYWDGSTWTTSTGSYSGGSLISNATGVSETAAPLGSVEWTGRDAPPVTYIWVGDTDGSWNTGANWSPSGVPGSSDTVTLTNGSTGAAANLNLTTAVTVNSLTFDGTGNFFTVGASPAAITVLGNVTYTGGTGTWNATSTFSLSSASSQTIPAFSYGNLNGTGGARVWTAGTTGIAGTFTPGAGVYTATSGSTVDYTGSGSQTIGSVKYYDLSNSGNGARTLTTGTIDVANTYTPTTATTTPGTVNVFNFSSGNSQTIPATSYANITNTGNGDRTLASSGTIGIAGTNFTPGSGVYTVTGSTVNFSNATGLTIPVLSPAATNNYNNLTISGAGAFVQGGSLTLGGNYSQTAGTYTVTSGASALALTVGGNFTQSAGTFNVTGNAATAGATVTVNGATSVFSVFMSPNNANAASLSLPSPTNTILFQANGDATFTGSSTTTAFDWMTGGTALTTYDITFGIKGNFNWSNTSGRPYVAGSGTPKGFVFNGVGTIATPQTLTYSGSTISYGGDFTVNAGTVVKLLTNIGIGPNSNPYDVFKVNGTLDTNTFTVNGGATNGTFTLASGATLRTANPNGVVSTTVGSISNSIATRTFNAAANYEFYGTAAIAANFPNTTMNNLTNSSTNTTTQGASITVNGDLNLASGTLASGTNPIALAGNIIGTGTHTSTGAGILTMNGASKTISGATLGIIALNNAAGFSLTGSPTINGNFTFTDGNLDLNGSNNVTLGSTATVIGETCSKQFINSGSPSQGNGYVQTTRTFVSGTNYLGIAITSATALGSTNIKRFVQKSVTTPSATNTIKRVYSITPATAATGNVTLTSSYCDGELNGNTESPVLITYYSTGTDETTGYSNVYATASNDATANTVTTATTGSLIAGQNNITLANAGPDAYYTVQNGDWNTAATWILNAVPPTTADVTVKHAVTVAVVDATANTLKIDASKSVTVASTKDLTVTDAIINNGTLTMQNNSNLIQTNNVANSGSGSTIVNRDTAQLIRLDYVLWSSPVSGQQLLAFSPLTLTNRFYTFDGTLGAAGQYVAETATNSFVTGKGFLIRMPWNHPTAPGAVFNGVFTGGTAFNGTLNLTSLPTGKFYATGNPYPSTIDADQFIIDNGIGDDPDTPGDGLYFWRKTNNSAAPSYATYTTAGGVQSGGDTLNIVPNGVIQVGEGFIVKVPSPSTSLTFNNDQRIGDNSNQFLKTTTTIERNRIWLNLSDSASNINQMMVAYMTGATQNIDPAIDGRYINDNPTALNSLINNGEFAIQGRSLPFDSSDVVPLAFKAAGAGNYTITLDHVDGLFTDVSQPIYVKDNLTTTYHDLNTGAYSFASDAGTFNDRFEIVYALPLGVDNPTFTANTVVVYPQNNDLVVNSSNVTMSSIKIFDIRGRLLQDLKDINSSQTIISAGLANQVLLVQITSDDGIIVTKKVIR